MIAERELEFEDSSGAKRPVFVRIGKPVPSEGGPWRCTYQIVGASSRSSVEERAAYGEDSMQALLRGLQMLGESLAYAGRAHGRLTFLGLPDLGIPRAPTPP